MYSHHRRFRITQQDQLLDGWKRTRADRSHCHCPLFTSSAICRRAVSVLFSSGLTEGKINKKNASRSIGGFGHLRRYKPCCWPLAEFGRFNGLDVTVSWGRRHIRLATSSARKDVCVTSVRVWFSVERRSHLMCSESLHQMSGHLLFLVS